MRVVHEKESDGVREFTIRKSDGVTVYYEKKSAGVGVHHEKNEQWGKTSA